MSGTMKAAVFEGEGKLTIKQVPIPEIRQPDEVLLKVEAGSICGTDCHILSVPPGHPATAGSILCHEYLGRVEAVGTAVTHLKPGDRVAVDPNLTCGLCPYCRIGMPNMCENMTTLGIFMDGGFAPWNVAPAKALHPISQTLPVDLAIFAEPLSCVVNGANRLALRPGENVVILGAGPIGLYYTALLKLNGAGRVIVVEINDFRAAKAKEMGADVIINPKTENVRDVVMGLTSVGADAVVDCVGSLVNDAVGIARRGAKILLFGMNSNARCEFTQNTVTRNELQIIGTYIANSTFPATIKLLESGRLPLEKLVTHRIGLDDIPEGVAAMKKGDAIEVIVIPE